MKARLRKAAKRQALDWSNWDVLIQEDVGWERTILSGEKNVGWGSPKALAILHADAGDFRHAGRSEVPLRGPQGLKPWIQAGLTQ